MQIAIGRKIYSLLLISPTATASTKDFSLLAAVEQITTIHMCKQINRGVTTVGGNHVSYWEAMQVFSRKKKDVNTRVRPNSLSLSANCYWKKNDPTATRRYTGNDKKSVESINFSQCITYIAHLSSWNFRYKFHLCAIKWKEGNGLKTRSFISLTFYINIVIATDYAGDRRISLSSEMG